MNGMVQQHNNQLPPPPPGFMQPSTHMNSFGSKILPYLNMGSNGISNNQNIATTSSQQQQQHNGWPNGFNTTLQQHKGCLLFYYKTKNQNYSLLMFVFCFRFRYL